MYILHKKGHVTSKILRSTLRTLFRFAHTEPMLLVTHVLAACVSELVFSDTRPLPKRYAAGKNFCHAGRIFLKMSTLLPWLRPIFTFKTALKTKEKKKVLAVENFL